MKRKRRCVEWMAGLVILLATAPAGWAAEIQPGLYLRTTYAFGNLSLNTIYIGSGNRIAIDPPNGVDPFDFSAAARQSPANVGTFQIVGNNIVINWANGKMDRLAVEFENGSFSAYDGGLVTRASAFPKNGTALTGTFAGSGTTQNVSGALSLTLTADGRFTMTSLGGIRNIPNNNGKAETTVQGTYRLYGNTMELKMSSGDVTKHTVLPFNTARDPNQAKLSDEHLIFDGNNLKREK